MAEQALLDVLERTFREYRAAETPQAVSGVTQAVLAELQVRAGAPQADSAGAPEAALPPAFLTLLRRQEQEALERLDVQPPPLFPEDEHARLERLVAASPISVAVGALDGSLVMVNDAYLTMLGFTRAEYEAGQMDWVSLTPPEYAEQDARMFAAAFAQGICLPYEKVMLTKTGERLDLQVTLVAAGDRPARRVIGYLQDVTPERTRLRQRESQQAELERQVQLRTQELAQQTRALNTFVEFTTKVAHTNDLLALVRAAGRLLQNVVGHGQLLYLAAQGGHLRVVASSAGLAFPAQALQHMTFPVKADFLSALRNTDGPVLARLEELFFLDEWPEDQQDWGELMSTLLFQPFFQDGEVQGLLVAGTDRAAWTPEEQAIIGALARSLGLAIARVRQAAQLQEQSEALLARTRALESFAVLARELAFETDPTVLVRRAQGIVRDLIGDGVAMYYELSGTTWYVTAQVGVIQDPDLQATLDAGLPYDQIENLRRPWESRVPYYQDLYDRSADQNVTGNAIIGSTATIPLIVGGQLRGVFAYMTHHPRVWSRADRAALEAAVHQLGLALERALQAQELEAQRQALQDANEELEAFAYSVSHDLRTPVRHAKSFAELAVRAMNAGQTDKVARHLGVVVEASERMNTLIDSMLELSRTSRQELHVQRLDLSALVQDVKSGLQAETAERCITWDIGPLPEVKGDRQLLYQVFTNLLGNAVKYTRGREEAKIRVWADPDVNGWTIHVQDNGAGFDERYASNLFGVFQRLHHQHEFEGTGVGLANVRRIVVRHGGTVSARGKVGEGATFSFTLPETPPGSEG